MRTSGAALNWSLLAVEEHNLFLDFDITLMDINPTHLGRAFSPLVRGHHLEGNAN